AVPGRTGGAGRAALARRRLVRSASLCHRGGAGYGHGSCTWTLRVGCCAGEFSSESAVLATGLSLKKNISGSSNSRTGRRESIITILAEMSARRSCLSCRCTCKADQLNRGHNNCHSFRVVLVRAFQGRSRAVILNVRGGL